MFTGVYSIDGSPASRDTVVSPGTVPPMPSNISMPPIGPMPPNVPYSSSSPYLHKLIPGPSPPSHSGPMEMDLNAARDSINSGLLSSNSQEHVPRGGLPPIVPQAPLPPHTILPPPHKVFNSNKQPVTPEQKDEGSPDDSPYSPDWERQKNGKGQKRKRTEETAEVRKERHNQAEKKRRSDMNGAIQKLKSMLPEQVTKDRRLTKVDILTETADHLTQVQNLCAKLLAENKQFKNQLGAMGNPGRVPLPVSKPDDNVPRMPHGPVIVTSNTPESGNFTREYSPTADSSYSSSKSDPEVHSLEKGS